ncbi:hypothetical protein BGZ61DRAFT_527507 [Ilyonectria robusta]|uniref:uncharacterized protein n=1 Tax=Ilyonectria robusta TaxID=1079257 RepID=UPI001E8DC21B|nr:uncharacterized protein BGZ61DRAFT_527507 [Ilyonectria robusta]KAH8736570.1 hypothetical protein BGZ61DRAFT_527507 [Ilyonectria robusta]
MAKGTFSQVSKDSDDAIREARSSKRFPDPSALDSFVTDQVRKKMEAMTQVIKTYLDVAQNHIRSADHFRGIGVQYLFRWLRRSERFTIPHAVLKQTLSTAAF